MSNEKQPEKKEVPNQHLADRIAGKVDEKGQPIKQPKVEPVAEKKEAPAVVPESPKEEKAPEAVAPEVESKEQKEVPNQHLADRIAGKVDEKGKVLESEEAVEEAASEETIEHVISEEDVKNNPDLADLGVKAGDKVEIPVGELEKGAEVVNEPANAPETVGGLRVETADEDLAPETVNEGAYAEDEGESEEVVSEEKTA